MRSVKWFLIVLLLLALGLAACGDDGGDNDSNGTDPTPESTEAASPALATGPDLAIGVGNDNGPTENSLPGCSDSDAEECPNPVVMDLDATVSSGGVSVSYPERYFNATTNEDGVLIEITPSENNKFDEEAVFEIYFADSIEDALAGLTDPDTAEWSNDTLAGTIGVTRDSTQDPPVNTTIGAFDLADGRTVVVKLQTTGQYGWDLWLRVYEDMLNMLAVE